MTRRLRRGLASEPRASGHEITAEGPVTVEPWVSRAYAPAGASVLSTVADMLRFAAMHLEDPLPRFVTCFLRRDPNSRMARRVVPRLGALRLGWRPCVGMGRPDPGATVRTTAHARAWRRGRLDDEQRHRSRDVPVAVRRAARDHSSASACRRCNSSPHPARRTICLASPVYTRGPTGAGKRPRPTQASSWTARAARSRPLPVDDCSVPRGRRRSRQPHDDVRCVRCRRSSRRALSDALGTTAQDL